MQKVKFLLLQITEMHQTLLSYMYTLSSISINYTGYLLNLHTFVN